MMSILHKVIKESLSQGVVDLYHFSKVKEYPYPTSLVLLPEKFSEEERRRSSIPRVFLYPETPIHAYNDSPEIKNRRLYKTSMLSSEIYDMVADVDGIVKSGRNQYGYMDQDKVLNQIRENYLAAYNEGNFPVVLVFKPIEVYLVSDEEKKNLMKK
jgi:hypothetical protein